MMRDQKKKELATMFVALFEASFRGVTTFLIIPIFTMTIPQFPITGTVFLVIGGIMFTTAPFVKVAKGIYI
jgi:hypothetical protein